MPKKPLMVGFGKLTRGRRLCPRRRAVDRAGSDSGGNLHQVKEHQACMQLSGSRDMAILLFLFFGAEHEIKAVVFVVADRYVFVVGVHDEISASSFVVLVNKTALYAVHEFCSDVFAHELTIDAKPSDQNCRIDHVALLLRHVS